MEDVALSAFAQLLFGDELRFQITQVKSQLTSVMNRMLWLFMAM